MFDPWVGEILWRREWLPTPVFLPEEFHGQRSMEGNRVKGHNELDTTASLVIQWLKRLPAVQETRVSSLGQEDPLEKEMATHSSILTWRIPWRDEPDRLQSTGLQRVRHDWATSLSN